MEFIYELQKEEIKKESLEKFKKWLRKKNIKFIEISDKLIIKSDDFYFIYRLDKLIEALKVGFNFKDSIKILTEDWEIYKIDIKKAANKKENHMRRILSRVIGEDGKFLRNMEQYIGVKLIVKDRYLYILGDKFSIQSAFEGFKRLISGASHSKVLDFAIRYRKHLKYKEKEAQYFQKYNIF